MHGAPQAALPKEEEAVAFIVRILRERRDVSNYGYEVYARSLIVEYIHEVQGVPRQGPDPQQEVRRLSSIFLAALWTLSRFGVLRPGPKNFGDQSPATYQGYAVTEFGRAWLQEEHDDFLVASDPGRTSQMLRDVGAQFGAVYAIRASDAARCYVVHAFFACCAMAGAAAEAVLLAAASARIGEDEALRTYTGGAGRSRLQTRLLGDRPEWLRREFESHAGLIGYWRDQAAHAHQTSIGEAEAFNALRGLLRFASFARDNWAALTV
jgi:hypothetical protein